MRPRGLLLRRSGEQFLATVASVHEKMSHPRRLDWPQPFSVPVCFQLGRFVRNLVLPVTALPLAVYFG